MVETWKTLFDGKLLVSNKGRVWVQSTSIRHKTSPHYGSIVSRTPVAKHKYYSVRVLGVGTRKVHQLICEAFNGPKPFDTAVVIHLDENALNNSADNLKWGTQKENLNMPGFVAYCKGRTGDNSPVRKGRLLAS